MVGIKHERGFYDVSKEIKHSTVITSFMSFHVNRSGVEPYSKEKKIIKHTTRNASYFTLTEN